MVFAESRGRPAQHFTARLARSLVKIALVLAFAVLAAGNAPSAAETGHVFVSNEDSNTVSVLEAGDAGDRSHDRHRPAAA